MTAARGLPIARARSQTPVPASTCRELAQFSALDIIAAVRPVLPLLAALSPLIASPAFAQLGAFTGTGNNLDIEHYEPAALGLSTVHTTRAQRWREYAVGLFVHYSRNPLVLFADRLQIGEVVGHRISMDVIGSIGILPWLDVGLVVPVTWWQDGDDNLPTSEISKIGFRDIRLHARFTVLKQEDYLIGLAFIPELSFPSGGDASFLGDGNVGFLPQIVLDRSFDILWGLRFGFLLGANIRPRAEIGNIEIDDELFYRLGGSLGLPALGDLKPEAIVELTQWTRLSEPFAEREANPLLASLALRGTIEVEKGHQVIPTVGAGIGTTRGYGSPDLQVFAGVVYRRYLSDRDLDGIIDDDDFCPDDPEDKDGFEDLDGCPEADNDKDGLPDVSDQCPNDPEDKDNFEDLDGCPDPDNDKDGIPDVKDECPLVPEDFDGFDDADGCPEEDNDKDGIPDDQDKCLDQPETINGIDDEDGCPDEGEPHVEVTSEKVTIDTKIQFDFDSDVIKPESFGILDQVALTLKANPQLKRIKVEGHTDERGTDAYNLDLSNRRAASVMRYLVGKGIGQDRLESEGFGESKPLVKESNEAAWATNRRVEFTILDQTDVDTGTNKIEAPPPPQ
jgi:outer membrane protein OmpA-like peptidoglycan-associated protein